MHRGLLGVCGAHGAQVVRGLQPAQPSQAISLVQFLARGARHVDVERLGLVDPLLTARRCFHQPDRFHLEGRGVQLLEFLGHAIDPAQRTVEVLEVGHHDAVPQAQSLEVAHEVFVHHSELAGEVGLDRDVAEARLDGGIHADDVGDGGRGRNGHAVAVAHAVLRNALAQRVPVHGGRAVHLDMPAAMTGQQVQ